MLPLTLTSRVRLHQGKLLATLAIHYIYNKIALVLLNMFEYEQLEFVDLNNKLVQNETKKYFRFPLSNKVFRVHHYVLSYI